MPKSRLTLGLILSLYTTIGWPEDTVPLKAAFSGTFVSTQFDTDKDGAPAGFNLVEGRSSLGPFSLQALDESVPSASISCPSGNTGIPTYEHPVVTGRFPIPLTAATPTEGLTKITTAYLAFRLNTD
jgi:hypothetical protein